MTFTGDVALVTGSTRGIGAATAMLLAERGAHVLVTGRDARRGMAVVDTIRTAGGTAEFIAAVLGTADQCATLANYALVVAGHVDILVNNAAIASFGPSATVPEDEFDAGFAVNVKSPYYLVGELAPPMAERGRGVIVNVTTTVASRGTAQSAVYASSKAALNHLTRCWAAEYGPCGVRVNAVAPGPTLTVDALDVEDLSAVRGRVPVRRLAQPFEIARTIAYLASDEASFINGAILPADGGRTAV
ncbi:SDR family NAD(P)-dependent oxidoreductase [Mycolicibacterium arenosum]|uniref:SDR family oxidoreductase n=1 Tax=Mycolicibacterium arenosum TaxID=2952157 RepID=A0ABT1M710_9MYCO|nr:SDR family oxidoreductase [Mycolicibacterium sp. CAU 1645]MCP9274640.1 SDR family oxidoreductase [Mycolicibacterium sp. CAU 1645]